jgi:hypothetical protein
MRQILWACRRRSRRKRRNLKGQDWILGEIGIALEFGVFCKTSCLVGSLPFQLSFLLVAGAGNDICASSAGSGRREYIYCLPLLQRDYSLQ